MNSAAPKSSLQTIFVVTAGSAAAECAEQIVRRWQPMDSSSMETEVNRGLTWVFVDEMLHASLVEQLLRRIRRLPPQPIADEQARTAATLAALDCGATLVAGGKAPQPNTWEPALLVNLNPRSPLLQKSSPIGPALCVARCTSAELDERVLKRSFHTRQLHWL